MLLQVVYRLVEEQDPDILDRFTVTTVNGAAVLNLVGQLDYEARYKEQYAARSWAILSSDEFLLRGTYMQLSCIYNVDIVARNILFNIGD